MVITGREKLILVYIPKYHGIFIKCSAEMIILRILWVRTNSSWKTEWLVWWMDILKNYISDIIMHCFIWVILLGLKEINNTCRKWHIWEQWIAVSLYMLILFTDRVIVQFRGLRHSLQCFKTLFLVGGVQCNNVVVLLTLILENVKCSIWKIVVWVIWWYSRIGYWGR